MAATNPLALATTDSQAYSNTDWAEFYDIWIEKIFTQRAPDTDIFTRILKSTIPAAHPDTDANSRTIAVLDIGAGSGRVILSLLHDIATYEIFKNPDASENWKFKFLALDNAQAMLDRAENYIAPLNQKLGFDFNLDLLCASAAKFADGNIAPGSVQFALFAAGGLTHLTQEGEVFEFLGELKKVLDPQFGKAVISILKEFLHGEGGLAGKLGAEVEEGIVDTSGIVRLLSKDREGEVYVKYPTVMFRKGGLRTDKITLVVEDAEGKALRSHELEMSTRAIGLNEWEKLVDKAGFEIEEKIDGDIQIWWVLKSIERFDRASSC